MEVDNLANCGCDNFSSCSFGLGEMMDPLSRGAVPVVVCGCTEVLVLPQKTERGLLSCSAAFDGLRMCETTEAVLVPQA